MWIFFIQHSFKFYLYNRVKTGSVFEPHLSRNAQAMLRVLTISSTVKPNILTYLHLQDRCISITELLRNSLSCQHGMPTLIMFLWFSWVPTMRCRYPEGHRFTSKYRKEQEELKNRQMKVLSSGAIKYFFFFEDPFLFTKK